MNERNILISAKTKKGFEKIESVLDLLSEQFVKKFKEVKENPFSDTSLTFVNDNYSGDIVIPLSTKDITITFGKDKSEFIANSEMNRVRCVFIIYIEDVEYQFCIEIKTFSNIDKIVGMDILKKK